MIRPHCRLRSAGSGAPLDPLLSLRPYLSCVVLIASVFARVRRQTRLIAQTPTELCMVGCSPREL